MDLFKNITFLIFLFAIAALFFWQWRKTRNLHKQFMNLPEKERNEEEAKLYLDPVRNAYVRPQPTWLLVVSIVGCVLFFIIFGLQKAGILK
jgi:hypothetical protein